MQFRPCIDLRHGKVTQIVGSTLQAAVAATSASAVDTARENFVSDRPSSSFASLYKTHDLRGGHVIMLGPGNEDAARLALSSFPHGMQIGGGIDDTNAVRWLDAGASHVIVTSWLFVDSHFSLARLQSLCALIGRERLVVDLSCRRREAGGPYFVVTNRWQTFSSLELSPATLRLLSPYCAEFLVHGVDVEGRRQGIEGDLLALLGQDGGEEGGWNRVVYAGGVRDMNDIKAVEALGGGRVDVSVGSALDIFGGDLPFDAVVQYCGRGRDSAEGVGRGFVDIPAVY